MITLALTATTMLALAALATAVCVSLFLNKSRISRQKTETKPFSPKAAVLLAIRGPDPYLDECIRSLLRQDYPDYDLHIVVDSESDPAWDIVNHVIREKGAENARVSLLRDPLFTCSLKCSALLQMLGEVGTDVEVLAFIDGDVVPHSRWLRQLVAPLADSSVGASYGIPWYFPLESNGASIARKLCWMLVSMLMALCGWVWGGTSALPSRVFRDSALVERWSRSVSSDASIHEIISFQHLQLEWVTTLVIPNCEETSYACLLRQLSRTLVGTRLYLRGWPLIWLAVIVAVGGLLLAIAVALAGVFVSDLTASAISVASVTSYLLIVTGLALAVDHRCGRIARNNGAAVPPLTPALAWRLFTTIPRVHALYLAAALKAQLARSVDWRGIRYAVNGKLDIARVEHEPVLNPPIATASPSIDQPVASGAIPVPGASITARFAQWRQILLSRNRNPPGPAAPVSHRSEGVSHSRAEPKRW